MLDTIKQMISPDEDKLTASCRKTRHEALEKCTKRYAAEHETKTADLRDQLGKAETLRAKRVGDAQKADRETRKALHHALVSEFYEAVRPLAQAFIDEPGRKVTAALVALIKTYGEREEFEIGFRPGATGPMAGELLCFAFVDEALANAPNLTLTIGSSDPGLRYNEAVYQVKSAAKSAAELQPALEQLERVIARYVADCAGRTSDKTMADRYDLVRLFDSEAIADFDTARERQRTHDGQARTPIPLTRIERRDGTQAKRYSDGSIVEQLPEASSEA